MSTERFICIGNGGYYNRGCEAIVRGTMAILRKTFGPGVQADIGFYGEDEEIRQQAKSESDPAVHAFGQRTRPRRWTFDWFAMQCNRRLGTRFAERQRPLLGPLASARAALILGGDTYSLDYGRPTQYLQDDEFVRRRGVPLVLWGASVGPFGKDPEFESLMMEHLRTLDAVFVRESVTKDYLGSRGVSANVFPVADPAFLMEPQPVTAKKLHFEMPEGAIGLNFSPLIARYVAKCGGEAWNIPEAALEKWTSLCADLVERIRKLEERPIVLVPHVIHKDRSIDDEAFLAAVARKVGASEDEIRLVPGNLNAQELKWVIGKCHVFAGARTHSTIAALSSLVPTLSIGYSAKALGINRDIFGHTDHVEDSSKFDMDSLTAKFTQLLARSDEVREILRARIPRVCESSHSAGTHLRAILESGRLNR